MNVNNTFPYQMIKKENCWFIIILDTIIYNIKILNKNKFDLLDITHNKFNTTRYFLSLSTASTVRVAWRRFLYLYKKWDFWKIKREKEFESDRSQLLSSPSTIQSALPKIIGRSKRAHTIFSYTESITVCRFEWNSRVYSVIPHSNVV